MSVDYRALARSMAAYRACRPSRFTIACQGCGKELSREVETAWYSDARRALAEMALEEGWDLAGEDGRLGCAECCRKAAVE